MSLCTGGPLAALGQDGYTADESDLVRRKCEIPVKCAYSLLLIFYVGHRQALPTPSFVEIWQEPFGGARQQKQFPERKGLRRILGTGKEAIRPNNPAVPLPDR